MKAFGCGLVLALSFLSSASGAQTAEAATPSMAPVAQYLIPRDAEIALARSAAPNALAKDAEIQVFTKTGFQKAVKGTNGFVCLVARSWSAGFGDPNFWNPKVRAPICYNAVAALSQVPETIKRTQIALAGGSESQIQEGLKAAIKSGALPVAQAGSLSYMMSKGTYFNHSEGHWLPHLMFYMPETDLKSWGVGAPKSPVIGYNFPDERLTIFLIPIGRWSDGSVSAGSAD
jgi:hypothetical protein